MAVLRLCISVTGGADRIKNTQDFFVSTIRHILLHVARKILADVV